MSDKSKKAVASTKSSNFLKTLSFKDLGVEPFESRAASVNFAIAVRTLLQNGRQGTVGCKGRSNVSFSNKKPWKQKGTGRARAGTKASPLWRGGGVIHGPQARTKTLSVAKKANRQALSAVLSDFIQDGRIVSFDWVLPQDTPSTKAAVAVLRDANLAHHKVALLLPFDDVLTYASFMNIPNVNVLFFDQLNVFDLVSASHIVYLDRDAGAFKEMVSQWL